MFLNLFKARKSQISLNQPDISEFTGELFVGEPRIKLLNNGEITSFLCDSGASFLKADDTLLLSRPYDLLRRAKGVFCYITYNGKMLSTTLAPLYQPQVEYETAFSKSSVTYFAKTEELKVITQVRLYKSVPCEQREIVLTNRANANLLLSLSFVFEPYFTANKSAEVLWDKNSNAMTVGYGEYTGYGEKDEKCRYLAVGFYENTPFLMETKNNQIALQFDLNLPKGDSKSLHLLIAYGKSRMEAISLIHALRQLKPLSASTCAVMLSKNPLTHRIIQTLLPQILYSKRDSVVHLDAAYANSLSLYKLPTFKLSKDIPIVAVDIYSKSDKERISSYVESYLELKKCFLDFDLVFLYDGNSETEQNIKAVISDTAANIAANILQTKLSGIHVISKERLKPKELDLIYAASCHIATRSLVRIEIPQPKYTPIECIPPLSIEIEKDENLIIKIAENYYSLALGESNIEEIQVNYQCEQIAEQVKRISIKLANLATANEMNEEKVFSLCYVKEILFNEEKLHSNMVQGEVIDENILLLIDYTKKENMYFCIRLDMIDMKNAIFSCDRMSVFGGNWNNNMLPPLYDTCAAAIFKSKLSPNHFEEFSITIAYANSKEEALSLLCRNYVVDKTHKN